jgi:hypothetical protein
MVTWVQNYWLGVFKRNNCGYITYVQSVHLSVPPFIHVLVCCNPWNNQLYAMDLKGDNCIVFEDLPVSVRVYRRRTSRTRKGILVTRSQPSNYFNIWSPNKDIKKQYKKPTHMHYHSKGPYHEQHELQHKHEQHSNGIFHGLFCI